MTNEAQIMRIRQEMLSVEQALADGVEDVNVRTVLETGIRSAHARILELEAEDADAKIQEAEEAEFYSGVGQTIRAMFRAQDYDYDEVSDYPRMVKLFHETLAKHGLKVVDADA